jgi:hypothetical protein
MNSGSLLYPVAAGCSGNNCMASSFANHNPFIQSGQVSFKKMLEDFNWS